MTNIVCFWIKFHIFHVQSTPSNFRNLFWNLQECHWLNIHGVAQMVPKIHTVHYDTNETKFCESWDSEATLNILLFTVPSQLWFGFQNLGARLSWSCQASGTIFYYSQSKMILQWIACAKKLSHTSLSHISYSRLTDMRVCVCRRVKSACTAMVNRMKRITMVNNITFNHTFQTYYKENVSCFLWQSPPQWWKQLKKSLPTVVCSLII